MITLEKLNIYKRYNGDIDGWARVGSEVEQEIMQDEDWYLIEDLIQDLILMNSGKSATSYKEKTKTKLEEMCENEQVIQILLELSTGQ